MIQKLDHSDPKQAEKIRKVFQVSYAVEAELLNAKDFPPLKRPLESFINAKTIFYGFFKDDTLAAAVEVMVNSEHIHIHSLVVSPDYFRMGIASKMVNFLFQEYSGIMFIVETGAANKPAITLYERHGFKLVKQWMTEIGIEKVAFERRIN